MPSSAVSDSAPIRGKLIAESSAMGPVLEGIDAALAGEAPVLIEGESGSGKEFVARLIHAHSERAERPFETLHAPALPPAEAAEDLLVRQTRCFRRAAGGSLLVKEVWQLPSAVQQRVALTLPENPTVAQGTPEQSVWIMLSSSLPMAVAAKQGLLAYPLNTWAGQDPDRLVRITLPPLRRRPKDIPLLAELLSKELAQELRRAPLHFTTQALDRLTQHGWPGNISELRQVIFQLFASANGEPVDRDQLAALLPEIEDAFPVGRHGLEELVRAKLRTFLGRIQGYQVEDLHSQILRQVEKPLLELVLEQTRGNQVKAARILGINRNTLRKKIGAYKIRLPR